MKAIETLKQQLVERFGDQVITWPTVVAVKPCNS